MSQLRAPAPRSDRREGGRHGRSGARPAPAGTAPARSAPAAPAQLRIRSQLLRTSVLPAVAVALGGAAALLFVLRSTGAAPTPALWAALTGAAALTVASVTAAALGADRAARSVLDSLGALRHEAARDRAELRAVVEQLRAGEEPPPRPALPEAAGDEFDLLGADLARTHEVAVAAVVQASRFSGSAGDEQKVEVFVNLARRLQSLVHREIQILDELENETEDPELLKGLFHVDHLATRIRRHAENLAVLGGAVSRRQWSHPVSTTEVLRSAIAEVEQYPRVKLVPPIDGTLRGHAVADVIHLLAELVENATVFSAPHTSVLLRAQYVTAGLAIEVEDRGLGMPAAEQDKMNALLADPDQVNVAHLLQDGRIGLFVVAALARRHGITVRLQANIYGGVQAVLVLPQGLLGTDPEGRAPHERPQELPPGQPREPAPGQGLPEAPELPANPTNPGIPEFPAAPAAPEIPAVPEVAGAPGALTAPVAPAAPAVPAPLPQRHPIPPSAEGPAPEPVPLPEPEPYAYPRTPAHGTDLTDFGAFAPQVPPALPPQSADRPLLPRRRAQEHLVPQLREEPQLRQTEDLALHDPGLMAAFQRGIGLAESQPTPQEPLRRGDAHKE
ncbi:sensor histidine kinase KdpD [Streptomyces griseus]|uniref:sensor histidine kinase n=1 Tax=Streptomyces griseus TaxID=1911 RepID=UPI0004C89FAA|nr:ATP-binding protein [Streptomyces griseus]